MNSSSNDDMGKKVDLRVLYLYNFAHFLSQVVLEKTKCQAKFPRSKFNEMGSLFRWEAWLHFYGEIIWGN
jgi:hypothetical protein